MKWSIDPWSHLPDLIFRQFWLVRRQRPVSLCLFWSFGWRALWVGSLGWIMKQWVYRYCSHNVFVTWWRHQMETFSAWLALCAGNSPVPVNSPHKGQWRGALVWSLICVWINGWVNNHEAGDLRRHRGHYDVILMRLGLKLFYYRLLVSRLFNMNRLWQIPKSLLITSTRVNEVMLTFLSNLACVVTL